MIIFLSGPDTFRSRQRLHNIINKFKRDRDPQGFNVARLDCKTAKENIMQQIQTAPFLAERRMVVLENLLISDQIDAAEAILARIKAETLPETNVIVLWEGTASFKTKLAKEFFELFKKEKPAQSLDRIFYFFEELKGPALEQWIEGETKAKGGVIEKSARSYLSMHVGSDLWRLSGLIDQLLAYALTRPITLSDTQLFLEEKADDSIFNLVDAIAAKNAKSAFAMMREQYRQGNTAGYLFNMIVRQFRILLELRDLADRNDGVRSDDMAAQLGLHPFVVKKSLPMIKRYTRPELERIYGELLDIDMQTKTGQAGQSLLLDVFVGRLAGSAA